MSVYPRGSGGIKDQLSKAVVKVAGRGKGCQPATPTLVGVRVVNRQPPPFNCYQGLPQWSFAVVFAT